MFEQTDYFLCRSKTGKSVLVINSKEEKALGYIPMGILASVLNGNKKGCSVLAINGGANDLQRS